MPNEAEKNRGVPDLGPGPPDRQAGEQTVPARTHGIRRGDAPDTDPRVAGRADQKAVPSGS